MILSKTVVAIRKKPLHVRERYLLLIMAVVTPVLLTVWYATFHYETSSGKTFVKSLIGSITGTFTNPEYNKTFGTPTLEEISGAGVGSGTPTQ